MHRAVLACGVLVVTLLRLTGPTPAAEPARPEPPKEAKPVVRPPAEEDLRRAREDEENQRRAREDAAAQEAASKQAERLRGLLTKPMSIEFDAGPLKEALGFLSERKGVPILVDAEAFQTDLLIPDVESQPVRLPRMNGVRFDAVLRRLAGQVHGVYLLRSGHIEITTPERLAAEIGREVSPDRQVPLVYTSYDQRPLEQALKDIADSTESNVLLDPRAKEKAKEQVTATFRNVPVDTAVRLLADLAGLELVMVDAVHYVTTHENAEALRKKLPRAQPEPKPDPAAKQTKGA